MKNKVLVAGILVFILVVPAFFFLVAHFTGANHFGVPRKMRIEQREDKGGMVSDTSYYEVKPALFESHLNGSMFHTDQLKGKIVVYSIIFTNCKSICPAITSNLFKVYQSYKEDNEIKLITITVDPQNDSSERLAEYRKMFDIEGDNWVFLRNESPEETQKYIKENLFLAVAENEQVKGDFTHSEKVVLVDKEGYIREYYDATKAQEVDELISAIKIMKDEYGATEQ
jgi:protein SCO1/2